MRRPEGTCCGTSRNCIVLLALWPGLEEAVKDGRWVLCSVEEKKAARARVYGAKRGKSERSRVPHEWVWVEGSKDKGGW